MVPTTRRSSGLPVNRVVASGSWRSPSSTSSTPPRLVAASARAARARATTASMSPGPARRVASTGSARLELGDLAQDGLAAPGRLLVRADRLELVAGEALQPGHHLRGGEA